jgi:glycosyltransferase involved in cell wall biosynthesis
MRCPNLNELPLPPPGKRGWPWTEKSEQLPKTMHDVSEWPKVSIVTPSFNQGQFIEETIRSVLLQGYPNFEYIIIDGDSTDESLDIIKKYEKWLTCWISEPDNGQSHALNKGFAKASGEIIAYINSDDLYEPDVFNTVAPIFQKNARPHLVAGELVIFDSKKSKSIVKPWWPPNLSYYLEKTFSMTLPQPASFWSKDIYEKVGGFDESLHYCFDLEFILRIGLAGVSPICVPKRFARFREHPNSKTIGGRIRFYEEHFHILHKHAHSCGISANRLKKIKRHTNNDINYFQAFILWKRKGRLASFLHFFYMILKWPPMIIERRNLALARRLLTFAAKDVVELKYL